MSKATTRPLENDLSAQRRSMFVFVALTWAAYGILHMFLANMVFLDPYSKRELLFRLMVIGAGCLILGKPSSVPRFALFCFAWLGASLSYSPQWPNHILHTVAINSFLLIICLLAWLNVGQGHTVRERIVSMFVPVGRLCMFVLYFWVVVHKLNYDYLNPAVSCGWALYEESAEFIKDMTGLEVPQGSWMRYPCLLGALVIEALIPLLLVFRKTRFTGLILGVVFHLILSFHHNKFILSFTMMMMAHYMLFTTHEGRIACSQWWDGTRLGQWCKTERGIRLPLIMLGLFTAYALPLGLANLWQAMPMGEQIMRVHDVFAWRFARLAATGYVFAVLLLMIWFLRRWDNWKTSTDSMFALPKPVVLAIFPIILFINGMSPYIGLKTHHSYAMFSNLRTENQVSNHLFLPATIRVADYQDDLIHVQESNFPGLSAMEPGVRITRFEFNRMLYYAPQDLRVVYTENGSEPKTITFDSIEQDPSLARPAWLARHLLFFKKATPEDEPCPCRW